MIDEKEKTALCTSVGADAGQSISITHYSALYQVKHRKSITRTKFLKKILKIFCADAANAATRPICIRYPMNELYETVYQSRPPVIDGLLYSGTYLFAGAPKVGKSFFMAQLAYHISTGQPLWNYEVHQGTVLVSGSGG